MQANGVYPRGFHSHGKVLGEDPELDGCGRICQANAN